MSLVESCGGRTRSLSYISIEKSLLLSSSLFLDLELLLAPAIASLASHPKEEEDDNASRANAATEATDMMDAVDPRFIILLVS